MKAVVLGGGGLTGRVAVRDLARDPQFDEIVCADVDAGLAAAAARAASRTGVRAETVDVRNSDQVVRLLRGAAVCVNAVQYTFNLDVMGACLEARVPYLDFGGLFHVTRRQLEWDGRFRDAGLLAIPGLGQVPGLSNVLIADAVRDLDEVESVVIRDGWCDLTQGGPEIAFTWSPSTFLDEMNLPAMVWEDGSYREYPPMSGSEVFDFGVPVGPTKVYRTLHSEPATIPASFPDKRIRRCEWKEGGPGIEVLRVMAKLGLGSDRPMELHGSSVTPREFLLALLKREQLLGYPPGVVVNDWEILDIEVVGATAGAPIRRRATARFPPKPDWSASATEYAVGVCGSVGAGLLARGRAIGTGVVPPERSIPSTPFRAALRERGIPSAVTPPEPPLPPFEPPRTGT
ncbi:MAG TPA: saccharopine dehydrogenase C-terminal domain-containing protein [Thermoplasmata archaeon]|nr:saccharopine dehydrogenase C-terminal domain-containing protein [Thermoplasmata archaeon]